MSTPKMTEPGCSHPQCKLSHPHAGPAILVNSNADLTKMSDREIAEETLFWLRQAGQALTQLQKGGIGAMMSGMMGNMFSKGK